VFHDDGFHCPSEIDSVDAMAQVLKRSKREEANDSRIPLNPLLSGFQLRQMLAANYPVFMTT
jgi:hypothetical protein